MTEAIEERVAAHRSKTRQNKAVPFLIRDDGILFPNVPLIARKQNFRPYHGELGATIEQRMEYLKGFSQRRRAVVMSEPLVEEEPFDIARASKDDLIKFAMDEYSEPIDPDMHMNKIRSIVAKLAGVDPLVAQRGAAAGGLSKAD
jgi:hypothetical protein